MNVVEGTFVDTGCRYALVASRFNDAIVKELVEGCADGLRRHGVEPERIDLVWVPGAFEIGAACRRLARSGRYGAIVALGAVIRGSTSHYDHVTSAVTSGVATAGAETGIPVIFGVLTTDTIEQAVERAGTKAGNNGFKAAMAALEMVSLFRQLDR